MRKLVKITISLLAWLALVTPPARAEVLCLTSTLPPTTTRPSSAQLRLTLSDESAPGVRKLVARVSITRETLTQRGLKLNPSIGALKGLTPARFREFCGSSFTREIDLGQMIVLTWDIKDDLKLNARTVLFDQTKNLSIFTVTEAVNEFVKLVSAELDKRAGLVRGSTVQITPPHIVDLAHDSPLAAAIKVMGAGPDLERAPIRTPPHAFDDATVAKLLAGETLD